ncbi:MAG: zinc ribbon domain-containing protein [Puniceicoccales bacterium]|jgi:hypothetical protein|nr:zinc ribbon domain-containing protein [Puniceicoccales bacterium]
MPLYTYQTVNADGTDGDIFEVEQSASDPALTAHPLTAQAVRRVHQAPYLSGQHNERRVRSELNDSEKLSRLGFTKYERDHATGQYHKTRGGNAAAPEVFGGKH